jgi:methylated-DNA-[protein]-cysteine S-methyltransferase
MWTLFDTGVGVCGVAWNDRGLTRVQLPEDDDAATRVRLEASATPGATLASTPPPWVSDAVASVREHLAGRPQDLTSIALDLSRVTPLTAAIYRAAQAVPAGCTATYGELARQVGSPDAARAVGRAMATNPWPVIVPCHRVVAKDGSGGFSAHGGLVTKEVLLRLEGGTLVRSQQTSLFEATFATPTEPNAPRSPRK